MIYVLVQNYMKGISCEHRVQCAELHTVYVQSKKHVSLSKLWRCRTWMIGSWKLDFTQTCPFLW